jgi:uroporphyrinogen decarboxylase
MIKDEKQIQELREPDPASDGLLPLVLNRLRWAQPRIEDLGHKIRFSVSRGPLNIATFLMGMTEFLIALKTRPEAVHRLLRVITSFLKKWHQLQRETFPTIDGILILDDIVGFMGEGDFMEYCFPYLKELYASEVAVKFFHNDAPCAVSISHYADIGINVYNPGIQKTTNELKHLCDNKLTLFHGIPPRDVLSAGSPADVFSAVRSLLAETADPSRLILSCGGGMPPGVTTENLRAFLDAARGRPLHTP